ncbi:MAG: hypothetical protein ACNA7E_05590, partial [Wenzhouxiangellaceae bacterium]
MKPMLLSQGLALCRSLLAGEQKRDSGAIRLQAGSYKKIQPDSAWVQIGFSARDSGASFFICRISILK